MKRLLLTLTLAVALAFGLAQAQNVTITLAGYSNDTTVVQNLLAKFVNGKVPGVTVKWEPITGDFTQFITNALAAGTAPDIFYLDVSVATPLVASGKILPLNGLMTKEGVKESDFVPELIKAFTFNGKLYSIPKDFNALVTFYNKDFFQAAGVEPPNAQDTWTTYGQKIAKVNSYLQKQNSQVHGMVMAADGARMIPFALAKGGTLYAKDGSADSITSQAWQQAVSFYTSFQKKGESVQPAQISQGWPGAAFENNLAAAVWEGGWLIPDITNNNPTLNYGTAPLPMTKEGKRANFLFTVGYSIAADSKHPDDAFKVIKALTGLDAENFVLKSGLAIPSRVALKNSDYFQQTTPAALATKAVFDATEGAVPFSFGKVGGNYVTVIDQALTQVMNGKESVSDALAAAAKQLNGDLK
jgi:multiple sugar transport system substrate-binding protein